jgi:UPF0755 protein
MFLVGTVVALLAAAAMWTLSEDTAGLPPSAKDLSSLNRLYLRAYLRWNDTELYTASVLADGVFEVRPGESATEICLRLEAEGWVRSADLITNYLVYIGGDRSIGAGMYLLRAGENPRQIADSIASGKSRIRPVTVFPGWRREEIANALSSSGVFLSADDFLAASSGRPGARSDLDALYAEIPAGAPLEGFLFPVAYNVLPGESASSLVERMARTFWKSAVPELRAAFTAQGLSLYQAVTLASIIQREAILDEEMPVIASVFFNRLGKSMRLETDPTVQYAIGFQINRGGWWANPILEEDKGIDSPYNTYIYFGLPPGPISNPSLAALQAVAYPANTTYLFFQAACDGSGRHQFAETYAQHRANTCIGE